MIRFGTKAELSTLWMIATRMLRNNHFENNGDMANVG